MTTLPSFKSAFSSLADSSRDDPDTLASTSTVNVNTNTTLPHTLSRPQMAPLPLDLLPSTNVGAIYLGFRGKRKKSSQPAVPAYKRARSTSISERGSYRKALSWSSREVVGASNEQWPAGGLVKLGSAAGRSIASGLVEDFLGVDVLGSPRIASVGPTSAVGPLGRSGPTMSDLEVLVDSSETQPTTRPGEEPWRQGPKPGKETEGIECKHCGRRLRNAVTLQNHIRVVHDHSGKFKCSQCTLSFMWKSTLRNHVRLVHEKERPYACQECGNAFRWKSHLREHHWVVHMGQKPFKCDKCGKTFGRKNNMQKHMRRHTEEEHTSNPTSTGEPSTSLAVGKDATTVETIRRNT